MAVPKKRTGHSAQGKRRSNWKATKPTLTTCPNCGQAVLAHTVCTACGTYKGKAVSIKNAVEAPIKELKEETKSKKSSQKAKTEEAPVAEETKSIEIVETPVEEAKAEEVTEVPAEEAKSEENKAE